MRIIVSIEHPAWVHNFKGILQTLKARGDDVLVLAIDKDRSFELLDACGIDYVQAGRTTGSNLLQKGVSVFVAKPQLHGQKPAFPPGHPHRARFAHDGDRRVCVPQAAPDLRGHGGVQIQPYESASA